jgi:ATP-dependent DNA ligase
MVAFFVTIAVAADGEPSFKRMEGWVQGRDTEDAIATPPVLMAFDLLHYDGRELTGRPLRERRISVRT